MNIFNTLAIYGMGFITAIWALVTLLSHRMATEGVITLGIIPNSKIIIGIVLILIMTILSFIKED